MDLGRFARSRIQTGLWIGIPLILILLATVPSVLVLREARRGLNLRQALLDEMPVMEARARKTEQLLNSVTPLSGQAAFATEEATRRIDAAAKNSGLSIRSLKVTEGSLQTDGFQTIQMTAQVQGSLRAVAYWLDEVQKPGLLISVQSGGVQALGAPPEEAFAGEITLVLYLRTS